MVKINLEIRHITTESQGSFHPILFSFHITIDITYVNPANCYLALLTFLLLNKFFVIKEIGILYGMSFAILFNFNR